MTRPQAKPPEPPREAVVEKPKLRVIRNSETRANNDADPNVQRKIYMAEEHARFYEEMKGKAARRKLVEKITGVLMIVVLLAGSWLVYELWMRHREREERMRLELAAERNRLEKERHEETEREAELTAVREREARERKASEEKLERQAQKRREESLRIDKETFYSAAAFFADADLEFIDKLKQNEMPGRAEGRFYYLLPRQADDGNWIVVCDSTANGVTNLFWLSKDGVREPIQDLDEFFVRLERTDYLLAGKNRMYFHSQRTKPHVGKLNKENPESLIDAFFGSLAQMVKTFDCDCNNVRFEIVFVPEKSKKIVAVDTVDYGGSYSLDKVRDAVEDAYPPKTSVRREMGSRKKFKRTVVFWDGAGIKKGVDGVVYVSRTPPAAAYDDGYHCRSHLGYSYRVIRPFSRHKRWQRAEQTMDYWRSLRDEALKQEAAEQAFYRSQHEKNAADAALESAAAKQAYTKKIDDILARGTLFFRAKLQAVKE